MKIKLELIESTEDLIIDTVLLEMLTQCKIWKDASDNEEIQTMSKNIVNMTAYISKLRLDRASARITAEEQRRLKIELDTQLSKLINND